MAKVRFYEVVVDLDKLPIEAMGKITTALAALKVAGEKGLIRFSEVEARAPKRLRSDAVEPSTKRLQPQAEIVYKRLSLEPRGMTMAALRDALGIPEGSANGQLNVLKRRRLVKTIKGRPQIWLVPGGPIPQEVGH